MSEGLRSISLGYWIDAAGVGQLVRACNLARAAEGVLRIVHTTPRVREILERAALFGLLSGPGDQNLDHKRFKRLRTRRTAQKR